MEMRNIRSINKRILLAAGLLVAISIAIGFFLATGFNVTKETVAYTVPPTRDVMVPVNFTEVAKRVSPAVVNIRTVKIVKGGGRVFRHFQSPFGKDDPFKDFFERFFGDIPWHDFKQRSLGSGFIIDKSGFIVTNDHVIERADKITVKLTNGREFDAEIIGRDQKTDIALIKIKSRNDLPTVRMGDSDALQVGEWVIAIGSPFGLEHTVTAGIVSAKGRVIGSGPYDDFIQTDASINPGNSGGPLVNMKGEVVGINTAIIAGGQGIGFAIPTNLAQSIISQLKDEGEVVRGWIGVTIQDLSQDLAEYYGVEDRKGALVGEVFKGDPADKAGIRPKDVIIEVNGKKVKDSRDLSRRIAEQAVGNTVSIKILRDGRVKTVKVKIAKRPERVERYAKRGRGEDMGLGMSVSELTPEIANKFGVSETEGVIVTRVEPEGQADTAGVQKGDIIKEINRKPVRTLEDYRMGLEKIKKGDSVNLLIKRRGVYLVIKIIK
nr:DegQ family serine endoprotease [Desulfobacterales bacterium]